MTYPQLPEAEEVARHFVKALAKPEILEEPYRRWQIRNVLPEFDVHRPPDLADRAACHHHRHERDARRFQQSAHFFHAEDAGAVSRHVGAERCDAAARGCAAIQGDMRRRRRGRYLRMEYIQDLDGMWLEPHRDIKEKLFSMVIYLCTGPFAKDWGTDIYDHDVKWCGRGTAEFNSAVIFIAGRIAGTAMSRARSTASAASWKSTT